MTPSPSSSHPVQDDYPENLAHCYGCGRLNEHGLHIQSYWNGEVCVCTFRPRAHHIGIPGFVYGGLIASLIDCHACGAAAASSQNERASNEASALRFVTGTLTVKYLRPTPINTDLELRATIREIKGRKRIVGVDLFAKGQHCVTGEVICLEIPEEMSI